MALLLTLALVVSAGSDVAALTARVDALRDLANARNDGERRAKGNPLLKELRDATRDEDAPAELLVLLGRTEDYLGDPSAAALTLDRAVTRAPKNAAAHFFLGAAYQELDELEKAERQFLEATRLDGKRASHWRELGRTQLGLEKAAEAVKSLERALAIDPKDALSESMLGSALLALDRGADAVAHLERAFSLDPLDFDAAYNAGQHYQNLDQPRKALPLFEAVAAGNPDDWHVRAKLVQLHQALGELARRDARRKEVLALFTSGKVDPQHKDFCREQWTVKGQRMMAFESFALVDPRAVRYSFRLASKGQLVRVISLGSYEFTTSAMRSSGELKPDARAWHLDGYLPDGAHETFGIFKAEPSYDETRAMVVDVLAGKLKAASSMTPGAQKKRQK